MRIALSSLLADFFVGCFNTQTHFMNEKRGPGYYSRSALTSRLSSRAVVAKVADPLELTPRHLDARLLLLLGTALYF